MCQTLEMKRQTKYQCQRPTHGQRHFRDSVITQSTLDRVALLVVLDLHWLYCGEKNREWMIKLLSQQWVDCYVMMRGCKRVELGKVWTHRWVSVTRGMKSLNCKRILGSWGREHTEAGAGRERKRMLWRASIICCTPASRTDWPH